MQFSRRERERGLAATERRERARPARQRGWWARTQLILDAILAAGKCLAARVFGLREGEGEGEGSGKLGVVVGDLNRKGALWGERMGAWAHASPPSLCDRLRCWAAASRASSYARATVVLQPAYNPLFFAPRSPDSCSTPHRLTLSPLSLFSLRWILCTPFRNPHQPSHCPNFGLNAKSTQFALCTVPSYSTP